MQKLRNLLRRHREILAYLVTGGLTTLLSLAVYYLCVATFLSPEHTLTLQLANLLSWVAGVAFAYLTNRRFVFHSRSQKVLREAASFVASRLLTLFLDLAIMQVAVINLGVSDKPAKLFSQILVIILNYLLSKLFVFRSAQKASRSRAGSPAPATNSCPAPETIEIEQPASK